MRKVVTVHAPEMQKMCLAASMKENIALKNSFEKSTEKRWILHLDMDAFFASVEQLDAPEYRGKPLIVGGKDRGVVAAASYEARAFGVRSAMPIYKAKRLCPHAIFVSGRMARYQEKSNEVMEVLRSYSPLVEPASIDEAFVDLTGLEHVFAMDVGDLTWRIQKEVMEKTQLSCSVGLAPVKFLAKITSDLRKPSGVSILRHAEVEAFLQKLLVEKIPGVGEKTLTALHALGVRTVGEVFQFPQEFWERRLGKFGKDLYLRAQGIDERAVEPFSERKSESAESTFIKDITDRNELVTWLLRHSERVGTSLRKQNLAGRTITIKAKYSDFSQVTRSKTIPLPTNSTKAIYEIACALLEELNPQQPLRLIGVGVSHFGRGEQQLSLFAIEEKKEAAQDITLDITIDALRDKFGTSAIIRGKLFPSNNNKKV